MTQGSNGNDSGLLNAVQWRCIGPPRGGRTVAVAGDPVDPAVFYFGACAGGVWKTDDAGTYWQNISDGQLNTASIGAIAVSDSDPNVIYIGTGEACIRNNVTYGDGVYRSTDAGKTWTHLGLSDTRHISRVRIHPTNSDVVYVAALGHAFGPNEERGIFRSTDGGKNWERVLYKSENSGAADLSMDPNNPRILYAAIWQVRRNPWSLTSGGPESGIYRSTDGGDTWTEITRNKGLPEGLIGRVGIAASPAKAGLVFTTVEAEDCGLFRSDDYGDTWEIASDSRDIQGRPWYYQHVFADPQDADTVWVLNYSCWKSIDGGKTFNTVGTPHGDNHDLWIDPRNPRRMIEGNDGGATITFNGGNSWSTIYNQLTSQFYHVITDNRFPYHVYGTQQDNSAICVPSMTHKGAIPWTDCYPTGSSESGYIAVHPEDHNTVVSGSIGSSPGGGGNMLHYNHETGQVRIITVWPELNTGLGASEMKYRFQWTYPIVFSHHDPDLLYVTGNVVFKTADVGSSWEAVSPDLTRADPSTMEASGGPITKGHLRRGDIRDHLRVLRVAPRRQRVVGRLRRRPGAHHEGRRRELGEYHSAGPGRLHPSGNARCVPPRSGDRVHGRVPLQAGRDPADAVQDKRLRQDLDRHLGRHSRRRLHPLHPRRSREGGDALRRHRDRRLRLARRRRLVALSGRQSAQSAGARPRH